MKHYKPFLFKQFSIAQNNAAMKVGTDSVLLGAWSVIYPNERVLDIGTGTGLLSLMLAQKVDGNCIIDAVEIDKGAAKDARINIDNCKWKESIQLHNVDFNDYQPKNNYDVIISNPPFFEGLAPEPGTRSIARNASDKLSYKNLLMGASKLLKTDGRFYLILPKELYKKVIEIGLDNNLHLRKQLSLKPKIDKPINRVLIELSKTSRFNNVNQNTDECVLTIRNSNNEYSYEHVLLTKDYYLNH